jgi:hypothetical protein
MRDCEPNRYNRAYMRALVTLMVLIIWGGTRKQSAPASLGRVYHGTE